MGGLGQTDKNPLYDGQVGVQGVLMTLIAASVPWLLIPKPVVLYMQHANKGNKVAAADEECGGHGHGHGEFDLADVVIHQVIETIEYVLGTVSHTASYLRMWALSLAHQQLSLVFFTKTMVMAFNSGNPLAVYFLFGAFLLVTAGVCSVWTCSSASCTRCVCTGSSSSPSSTRLTAAPSPRSTTRRRSRISKRCRRAWPRVSCPCGEDGEDGFWPLETLDPSRVTGSATACKVFPTSTLCREGATRMQCGEARLGTYS